MRRSVHHQQQLGICLSAPPGSCPYRVVAVNAQEKVGLDVGVALVGIVSDDKDRSVGSKAGWRCQVGGNDGGCYVGWLHGAIGHLLLGDHSLRLHILEAKANPGESSCHADRRCGHPKNVFLFNILFRRTHLTFSVYLLILYTLLLRIASTFFAFCE